MSITFVGKYVDDFVDVLTASAVSGSHAIIVGPPGWGKTAISRKAAEVMGGGNYSFTRVEPSTPSEEIKGLYDPKKVLDGEFVRVLEGTPYDPGCKVAIIDELFRGSDFLFDAALDVYDRQDVDFAPPIWATANFVATGTRVQALIDRIGLWLWLTPSLLDLRAMSYSHLMTKGKPSLNHSMPDPKTIDEIRRTPPTDRAANCVIDAIETLAEEATKEGMQGNPRRWGHWNAILFSYAMYLSGSNDFNELPSGAIKVLRWAWPSTTAQEATAWAKVAGSAVDPVATAVDEALAMCFSEFERVSQMTDAADRAAATTEMGNVSLQAQQLLKALNRDDPRIPAATAQIEQWFGEAVRGVGIKLP